MDSAFLAIVFLSVSKGRNGLQTLKNETNVDIKNIKQFNFGLSGASLKAIACIAMFCSHIYYCLRLPSGWTFLNWIGRIAFPIFCFLLVEGFFHTSNWHRYFKRLLLVALLSEIPFDLAIDGTLFNPYHQNVLFTLAIGLFVMAKMHNQPDRLAKAAWLIVGMYAAWFFKTDYSEFGIIVIAGFYYFHNKKVCNLLFFLFTQLILSVFFYASVQRVAAFAVFFLALYNGKPGKFNTRFFYLFYPLHFLFLMALRYFFNL